MKYLASSLWLVVLLLSPGFVNAAPQFATPSVVLTWTPSLQPTDVTLANWNVYRSTVSTGPYSLIATVPAETPAYTDTSVMAGALYVYVVTAVSTTNAESAYSDWIEVTIPANPEPAGSTLLVAPPTLPLPPAASPVPPPTGFPSGLVLRWTFDNPDISDGIVADQSGNGNTGTLLGNAVPVAGKLNQALNLNGSSSYVGASGDVAGLTNSLTLSAWINTANASRTEAIFSRFAAAASGAGYIFTTDENGHLDVRIGGADITAYPNFVTDPTTINDAQWHHVVATISFELQTIEFYVDGKLTSSTAVSIMANGDGGAALQIGVNPWMPWGDYFTGAIDEVQVYSRALSDSEVRVVYLLTGGN